mgnify:CR=1 FL=1
MLKVRASNCSALFTGTDGLTVKQTETLDGLLAKKGKLTDNQLKKLAELTDKQNAPVTLGEGAKTLIEQSIDEQIYEYKDSISTREMTKGTDVEDDSIEIYNRIFFTNHHKCEEFDKHHSLSHGVCTGHPDIVDEKSRKVIDIKSSWSKKTFPKRPPSNAKYDWQVKMYLYMLTKKTGELWSDGEIAYILTNTPEELMPDHENDSLHYMDSLEDHLRATVVKVTLTEEDIAHMDARLDAAVVYADEYVNFLNNKNK